MEEQTNPNNSIAEEQPKKQSTQLNITDTAIVEYLEVVRSEYEIEREKNRASRIVRV